MVCIIQYNKLIVGFWITPSQQTCNNNGTYTVSFMPTLPGGHTITIRINQQSIIRLKTLITAQYIKGSPFVVSVQEQLKVIHG